jgi:hypothetical protein
MPTFYIDDPSIRRATTEFDIYGASSTMRMYLHWYQRLYLRSIWHSWKDKAALIEVLTLRVQPAPW